MMATDLSLNMAPRLLAGERVLYFEPALSAATGKSLPSYRLSPRLPLIQEMALYVTDRRVLLACWFFRLVRFEWAAWFPRQNGPPDQDHIEALSVGHQAFLGPYLELITSNPVRHWWRSRKARIRLFLRNPETLCRLISEALGPPTPDTEQSGAPGRTQPIRSDANPTSSARPRP